MSILGFGVGVGFRPPRAAVASPAFPSTGLVAYWGFDDSLTDSVGSKVLTASGGNSYVAGKLGTKALQLTAGNNAAVTTNDFDFQTNPFTVALWVKVPVGGVFNCRCYSGGDTGWGLANDQTGIGVANFSTDASGVGYSDDAFDIADGTWHFMCVRSDGLAGQGNLDARTELSLPGPSGTSYPGDLRLDAAGASCVFDGLAIWNVCLNDTQVAAVYNSGNGNSPA